ncbi:hypothetical protein F441_15634 [Phytophthora nicotianae CJ01A1]|uniref:Uncharacterized protein n=1 Tax=Phytophthora nicotianae CJ01A1 TaxID=1317063 RepID=W2WD07_PHYNI|nr:hypothetical protein F441_15634 [Phytophthora nicotianae CJ01A1]
MPDQSYWQQEERTETTKKCASDVTGITDFEFAATKPYVRSKRANFTGIPDFVGAGPSYRYEPSAPKPE